jgi:hypothetical protein
MVPQPESQRRGGIPRKSIRRAQRRCAGSLLLSVGRNISTGLAGCTRPVSFLSYLSGRSRRGNHNRSRSQQETARILETAALKRSAARGIVPGAVVALSRSIPALKSQRLPLHGIATVNPRLGIDVPLPILSSIISHSLTRETNKLARQLLER